VMSKQLATINLDVPLEVDLEKLQMRAGDPAALAELYRELGFNSLLKELLASGASVEAGKSSEESQSTTGGEKKDYAQFANVEGFTAYLKKLPAKAELAVWLNLETGEREAEGFGTRVAGIEVSQKEGEGRAVWADEKGEAMKALAGAVQDAKRRKIVHDPKLFSTLTGSGEKIEHATQLYSYLLRPTTANHNFADVIFRQFNAPIGGGAGSEPIICSGWRRF